MNKKKITSLEDSIKTRVASLDSSMKTFDGQMKTVSDLEMRMKKVEKKAVGVLVQRQPRFLLSRKCRQQWEPKR